MKSRILSTDAPLATILIRLLAGLVFLSEGIQKFLFPTALGSGRFEKIGLPSPELLGPLVGALEIVCGSLLVLGLLTRLASVPLIAVMSVAILKTKLPMLLQKGFWTMVHEFRTDWSMLLGCLFLLVVGGGRWSLDHRIVLQGQALGHQG
ncbi:DoxX family protein [bacterium]|nr:MAG: DoxX family protein [bacterium]